MMRFERLGNIVDIKKGRKPKLLGTPVQDSVRFLQIDDLRNDDNIKYTSDKTGILAYEDDVLIAWDGANAGTIGFGKSGYIGSTIALLRKKTDSEFNTAFIGKFLQSQFTYLRSKASGATIPHIDRKSLENLRIPVLPLNDQIRIADILSKAESLIRQRNESLRLLDEFLKSTFLKMFGDPEKKTKRFPVLELEKLCSEIVDCPHSTPIKSDVVTNYPCIRTSEIENGYINWTTMQYLDESEYLKRIRRLTPREGDIVYGREGSYGDAIRIPSGHKFSLGQRTMLFRPDYSKCNSAFLWAMVRSDFVYRQAKRKNSGSTVGHVNVKDIRKFKVLAPPLYLQDRFANMVKKIEILKENFQTSLEQLERLYNSLSQRAFSGHLISNEHNLDKVVKTGLKMQDQAKTYRE
jgi:restriction endonuclease S subunit